MSIVRKHLTTLPILDLLTGRRGVKEEQVTKRDLYLAQKYWRFKAIYGLIPVRREELCKVLVRLVDKVYPELKDCDAYDTWSKTAKNPEYPDEVLAPYVEKSAEDEG